MTTTKPIFVKEFTQEQFKVIEQTLAKYFRKFGCLYYSGNPRKAKRVNPKSFKQLDELLGLAYTSSSDCAGFWICNGLELFSKTGYHYVGFTFDTNGDVYGIAWDKEENEDNINLTERINEW